MWSRKQTRKSEQNWLCTRYSSHYWQTVNLSSLPLLIECFTSTNVDKHTNTREFSTKKKTIATVLSLLPHAYKSQEAWENVNEKQQTCEAEQYFWLEKKSHTSGLNYMETYRCEQCLWPLKWFRATGSESIKGTRSRDAKGTPVNSRAMFKLSRHTKFCWKHYNWNSRYPCSIFHI